MLMLTKFFNLLYRAVTANTLRPRPEEVDALMTSKMIRCSPELEGDSQIGMTLFIGISKMYGVSEKDIADFLGIEMDELQYKASKFLKLKKDASAVMKGNTKNMRDINGSEFDLGRFYYKFILINNYLLLYARQQGIALKTRNVQELQGRKR